MKKSTTLNVKIILKATLFCIAFTGLFVAFSFFKSAVPPQFERLAHGTIGTIAAFLTSYLFLKFDKKTFADIGLMVEKTTLKNFFIGLLMGIALMGTLSLGLIYFSNFSIETNKNSAFFNFFLCTLPFIPLAFMEEMGFRSYPLVLLKNTVGMRQAVIITAILFGFYHIVNGWTLQTAFLGAGVWGIIYGVAALYSDGIALPTGLHYAANLTTSAFGISDTSFNLWILKQKNGLSLENYESSQWAILIPQLIVLVLGVILMEWHVRKQRI